MLPLAPGRAQSHGFEYKRNGALSPYAALHFATGHVQGKAAARHTTRGFVDFLEQVVTAVEFEREVHIICDNLSTHKAKPVDAFLYRHPQVGLHLAPTHSSWLNQVELWFSKLQRDIIARGVLTSTADLM